MISGMGATFSSCLECLSVFVFEKGGIAVVTLYPSSISCNCSYIIIITLNVFEQPLKQRFHFHNFFRLHQGLDLSEIVWPRSPPYTYE